MTPYIILYALLVAPFIAYRQKSQVFKISLGLGVTGLCYTAIMKGPVGTDAPMYVAWAELASRGELKFGAVEPGFFATLRLTTLLIADPQLAVNVIAAVSVIVAVTGLILLPEKVAILLYSLIVPYLLVDGVFNGLRIGLALSIALLAYALNARGNSQIAIATSIIAISMQFTIALPMALVIFHQSKNKKIAIKIAVICFLAIAIVFGARILQKVELYFGEEVQKGWSGLSLLILIMIVAVIDTYLNRWKVRWIMLGLISAVLISALPNPFGHFSLRMAQLVLVGAVFIVSNLIINSEGEEGGPAQRANAGIYWLANLALFLAASTFKLRNIIDGNVENANPFVPMVWRS